MALELLPYADRLVGFALERARHVRPADEGDRARLAQVERGERQTSATSTLGLGDEEGLAFFNRMPSRAWWVRGNDLRTILRHWGLAALDGIVACGAGAPSETVHVASYIDVARTRAHKREAARGTFSVPRAASSCHRAARG